MRKIKYLQKWFVKHIICEDLIEAFSDVIDEWYE